MHSPSRRRSSAQLSDALIATLRDRGCWRAIGNSGGANRECVRYQGTYTASVAGAMIRKIAEPMIGAARFTLPA